MKTFFRKIKRVCVQIGPYGLLFAMLLGVFGFQNAKRVFYFWISDEPDTNEWNVSLGSKGETDYVSNFWGKMQFVNLNGLMRRLTGQHEMNGVVKLDNGYLLTTHPRETDEALQIKADLLAALDSFLDQKGIPMLFAVSPYTCGKYDPCLPAGVTDYGNDNIDRFLDMVDMHGTEYMDFREEIYCDGLDHYDMMYRTDHHWTTQAGFYAYTKLLAWIQAHTQTVIDGKVADLSNYTLTTYHNWHLGSRGQRTGKYFAGMDDFVLITPDFETSISAGDVSGTFTEMLIDDEQLQKRDATSRYTYDYVLGRSNGNYVNLMAPNDTRVLVVTDSFGKAVNPYLILSFREVRTIIDLHSYELSRAYIEDYKPDVVILLYYAEYLEGDNRGFSFSL